jgi:hypothetical protein
VILTGAGGIIPEAFPGAEKVYATDYYNAGFQIVMVAWDSDWEDTGPATKNIAFAAGRPAAFLRYIKTSLYDPLHQLNAQAGMCAQGTSAGSAAIAYSFGMVRGGNRYNFVS